MSLLFCVEFQATAAPTIISVKKAGTRVPVVAYEDADKPLQRVQTKAPIPTPSYDEALKRSYTYLDLLGSDLDLSIVDWPRSGELNSLFGLWRLCTAVLCRLHRLCTPHREMLLF